MAPPAAEAHVPHYDIYGSAHHRLPYKDKSTVDAAAQRGEIRHPKWLDPPAAIRSRAELQQARKRGRIPDPSYDFDGDGVVGQLDYFIGRSFDKDCSGSLAPSERRRAEKALSNGFLDKYSRGWDSQGDAHRPFRLQQRRGVIISSDNAAEASVIAYGKHFNADKVPVHATQTALGLSRTAEAKSSGTAFGERFMASNAPVPEPPPPNATTHPRVCPITNVRERAEADHQASRVRGGLLPVNGPINPEREYRTVGMGYDHAPFCATRSQLIETRRECFRHECEELAVKGSETFPPNSVRRTKKEAEEFEFRRGGAAVMTLTRLKDQRRRDKREYDMQNFGQPGGKPVQYPRFSDRADIPFWATHGAERSFEPGTDAVPMVARHHSEPCFKVTEQRYGEDLGELVTRHTLPEAAYETAAGLQQKNGLSNNDAKARFHPGSNTVKRWTVDQLERGQGRNMPRVFDNIQPAKISPKDLESMELTSSMAPIREDALRRRKDEQRRNADKPKRGKLWCDAVAMRTSAASRCDDSGFSTSATDRDARDMSMLVSGPAGVKAQQVQHSGSDPTFLKTNLPGGHMDMTGRPRMEPRFFGSTSGRAPTGGVRTGGFHVLTDREDWQHASSAMGTQQPGGTTSKSRADPRGGGKAASRPTDSREGRRPGQDASADYT